MARLLVLDISTAPLENAAEFITTDDIQAPSNYKDPAAIQRYIDAEKAKRLEKAALDPDTCRMTAIGSLDNGEIDVATMKDEAAERFVLDRVIENLQSSDRLVSFNGFKFDLPILMRRCAYLGLPVPDLNLDLYRSPHIDLYDRLTFHGAIGGHSLDWYRRRHGWTDCAKPLSGHEESRVFETGKWDELAQSVRADLTATYRLAQWLRIIPASVSHAQEPVL